MADTTVTISIDPRFSRILQQQRQLQMFLLGKDPSDLDPKEMADYIRTQAFAATDEIHEVANETHWKPWSVRPDGEDVIVSKQRYIGEIADAYIFLMNLMLVGGVTSTELAHAVESKQKKNLDRWTNGYNAQITKCKGCGRSFDDEGVKCYAGIPADQAGGVLVLAFCAAKERFIDQEGNPV